MSGDTFDLAAHRRQRKTYTPKAFEMTDEDGAVEWKAELSPELPAETLDKMSKGEAIEAIAAMFVYTEDAQVFLERYKPSLNDIAAIIEQVYGEAALGESLASGKPSTSDGTK